MRLQLCASCRLECHQVFETFSSVMDVPHEGCQSIASEPFQTKPIGYMRTPFLFKNGTPRQPTVCAQARGELTILKSVFNNPEHALEGLEQFTHVWIFFIFHKNNNAHTKAKVKPPRLNGKKVGVFSTRSPYRPNNIGLTLARIEAIKGATIFLSGLDILDGTPVVDLKPYIPQYDIPVGLDHVGDGDSQDAVPGQSSVGSNTCQHSNRDSPSDIGQTIVSEKENMPENDLTQEACDSVNESCHLCVHQDENESRNCVNDVQTDCHDRQDGEVNSTSSSSDGSLHTDIEKETRAQNKSYIDSNLYKSRDMKIEVDETKSEVLRKSKQALDHGRCNMLNKESESHNWIERNESEQSSNKLRCLAAAEWIDKPPLYKLSVRFTVTAENQLRQFSATSADENFKFLHLKSSREAREAIVNILQEDPRSTYRRKHCMDSLYYFTVDVVHVTCWFDETIVEVVRVRPAGQVQQCKHVFTELNR